MARADEAPGIEDRRPGHEEVDASQAPLIEHLAELRTRLIRALIALGLCVIACFVFRNEIFTLLSSPLTSELQSRGLEPKLITTGPTELFFAHIRISVYLGLFVSFPLIATQLWRFVAPGLYADEKQAFWPFLVATPVLFLLGGSLVYFVVSPLALGFFLDYNADAQTVVTATGEVRALVTMETRVVEYVAFVALLIFAFGLAFQLPVLLTLLGRAGIISAAALKSGRKYAIVGLAVAAAVLTPPDPVSQISLLIPLFLLYEISIFLVGAVEKKREEKLRADGYYDDEDDA